MTIILPNASQTIHAFCKIVIPGLVAVVVLVTLPQIALATGCNTNCEDHFDKWYQIPDLLRCQTEREAACRWGVEHCDFHEYNYSRVAITEIIQEAHDTKNDPQDAAQCYRYIDGASLAYSIGEEGYQAYQLAQGVSSKFNPYTLLAVETAKQVLRCSCKAVDWSTDITSDNLYVNGIYEGVETGTRVEPYKTVGLAYTAASTGAVLRIQSGTYPEQITLTEPITLVAEGGTVIIGW